MNRTETLKVLESGDFSGFIGIEEGDHLDFKGSPYPLVNESQKYELAKDVAAFANGGGGVIVIGIKAEPPKTSTIEQATQVSPFSESRVDRKQYRDIVRSRVHPKPADLDIRFHPSKTDPTRGLASIDVPKQPEAKRPFLVGRPVPDGTKTIGWLIGYHTRRGDANDPVSIEELHQQLRQGAGDPTTPGVLEALGRIEERLALSMDGTASTTDSLDVRAAELIRRVAEDDEQTEAIGSQVAHMYLAAAPDRGRVREFLAADGARRFLEHPPYTRADGWNLITLDTAQVINGAHLRVGTADRKRIDLFQDGGLVALAVMPDFIARGSLHEPWTMSGPALAEFIYDFLAAYAVAVRAMIDPTPTAIGVALQIRQAQWEVTGAKYSLRLSPYEFSNHLSGIPLPGGAPAPSFSIAAEVPVDAEHDPPFPVGAIAHQFVQGIFAWYPTDIPVPYSFDSAIDPDKFPRR